MAPWIEFLLSEDLASITRDYIIEGKNFLLKVVL